eukprot:scaffold14885_cov65-Phaeocystis_antarctica.AAC.15
MVPFDVRLQVPVKRAAEVAARGRTKVRLFASVTEEMPVHLFTAGHVRAARSWAGVTSMGSCADTALPDSQLKPDRSAPSERASGGIWHDGARLCARNGQGRFLDDSEVSEVQSLAGAHEGCGKRHAQAAVLARHAAVAGRICAWLQHQSFCCRLRHRLFGCRKLAGSDHLFRDLAVGEALLRSVLNPSEPHMSLLRLLAPLLYWFEGHSSHHR